LGEIVVLGSQDMVFTLYGDYIRYRGGEIWTGSLIELLRHLGMSEQAVRSVLSRMWKKGWLKRRRVGRRSYYSLTKKSVELLTAGARRIFEPEDGEWSGDWYVVAYNIPESKRLQRNKLRRQLTWMGCGAFNTAIWISPWDVTESISEVSRRLHIDEFVQVFRSQHLGFAQDKVLVARCWDLKLINSQYEAFVKKYEPMLARDKARIAEWNEVDPGECFGTRFMLLHEYREFPFVDPHLPPELLPSDWLSVRAAELFKEYYALLTAKANQFVDSVFEAAPD
jgi:phenylacetic acid degradation operon negative regulatory protein